MAGVEWLVEGFGCSPASLRDVVKLHALLDALIHELPLHPVGQPMWHKFDGEGGVTGLCLLAESHFACHTFPETGTLCLNLFCCKPRPDWDFAAYLQQEFSAASVQVRRIERPT